MSNQMRPVIIKSFEELNKAELYQIIQLRIAVFIVEQDCPYPDLDDMDQDAQHLWIEDAGEIVCYLRVNPAEKLIKKAIDLVCEKESRAIRISAQCYLEKYYEKFGFLKASEEYLEDDIPHIEMLKDA